MDKKRIEDELIGLYKKYMENGEVELFSDTRMTEIEISSVDYIKVIIDIENEFDFEFDDDDLSPDRFEVIEDMVDYIYDKI